MIDCMVFGDGKMLGAKERVDTPLGQCSNMVDCICLFDPTRFEQGSYCLVGVRRNLQ